MSETREKCAVYALNHVGLVTIRDLRWLVVEVVNMLRCHVPAGREHRLQLSKIANDLH